MSRAPQVPSEVMQENEIKVMRSGSRKEEKLEVLHIHQNRKRNRTHAMIELESGADDTPQKMTAW